MGKDKTAVSVQFRPLLLAVDSKINKQPAFWFLSLIWLDDSRSEFFFGPCWSKPVILDSSLPFTSHSFVKARLSTLIHHSSLHRRLRRPRSQNSQAQRRSIRRTETKCKPSHRKNGGCWLPQSNLSYAFYPNHLNTTTFDHEGCLVPATSNCCLKRNCLRTAAKEISPTVIIPSH